MEVQPKSIEVYNGFIKLQGVSTQSATAFDDFINNAVTNLQRSLKDFKYFPGFQEIKGHHRPVGLIGGGPSIKKEVDNIRAFQNAGNPIVACGSSYDWLRQQDLVPDYCVVCDPDPLTMEYLKLKHARTIFFLSYSCDPKVFDHLKDNIVYPWHCHSEGVEEKLKGLGLAQDYFGVAGGCTVGLRAINVFLMLGYTNQHLWGFDSCMGEDEAHHAYEFATDREEVGDIYKLRIGGEKPDETKTYSCVGYQLAQAHHFQDFYFRHHMLFTPTFHGEGMLKDFMEFIHKNGVVNELKAQAYKQFHQGMDFVVGN